jgi:hypothetical protein
MRRDTYRDMQIVRTDYVQRQHIYVDANARRIDCFEVELLDHSSNPIHGDTPDALWQRVQAIIAAMRGQYERKPLYPVTVLQPFATILCLDLEREQAAGALPALRCAVGDNPSEIQPHEQRFRGEFPEWHGRVVNELCSALDLMDFLDGKRRVSPLPKGVGWQ